MSTVSGAPATLHTAWSAKMNPVLTWSRTVIVIASVSEKQTCPL